VIRVNDKYGSSTTAVGNATITISRSQPAGVSVAASLASVAAALLSNNTDTLDVTSMVSSIAEVLHSASQSSDPDASTPVVMTAEEAQADAALRVTLASTMAGLATNPTVPVETVLATVSTLAAIAATNPEQLTDEAQEALNAAVTSSLERADSLTPARANLALNSMVMVNTASQSSAGRNGTDHIAAGKKLVGVLTTIAGKTSRQMVPGELPIVLLAGNYTTTLAKHTPDDMIGKQVGGCVVHSTNAVNTTPSTISASHMSISKSSIPYKGANNSHLIKSDMTCLTLLNDEGSVHPMPNSSVMVATCGANHNATTDLTPSECSHFNTELNLYDTSGAVYNKSTGACHVYHLTDFAVTSGQNPSPPPPPPQESSPDLLWLWISLGCLACVLAIITAVANAGARERYNRRQQQLSTPPPSKKEVPEEPPKEELQFGHLPTPRLPDEKLQDERENSYDIQMRTCC